LRSNDLRRLCLIEFGDATPCWGYTYGTTVHTAYGLRWDAKNETAYPTTLVLDAKRVPADKLAEFNEAIKQGTTNNFYP
jgi:hypothetical protein